MKAEEVVIVNEAAPLEDIEMKDVEDLLPGKSLLLNLPPEILQLVLFHADTGALLTGLTCCKKIFDAAKAKHVVLQHMNRMPGLRLGLADLDSKTLFDTFRQRAAKSLYAAGVSVPALMSFFFSTFELFLEITELCNRDSNPRSSTDSQLLGFGPYHSLCTQR